MWIIGVLMFASIFGGAYLLLTRAAGSRLATAERLDYYTEAIKRVPATSGRWANMPAADRVMGRLSLAHSLEQLLDQADLPLKPFEFILITFVSALGLAVLTMLFGRPAGEIVASGMIGLVTPLIWVIVRRSRRREAFNRQLPDALQAISGSLRAGFGFNQGLMVVATDQPPPISVEFARTVREMNLGLTVEDVLQNMARRMQSLDFDLAVSGILINRQIGGNLAELLDQITATLRERVKLKNFIRVLTAQQRISAIVVAGVPPVVMVVLLLGLRDYSSYLVGTRIGHVLLAMSVLMQIIGIYLIRRIMAIEV